jgi:DNA invertase Pin-like site-specific DNA recombinase
MLKQAADGDFTLHVADIWDENVDGNGRIRPASAGAQLADRPKVAAAVSAIERGEAGVLVAERFDRLFRNLDVQREVIGRVEAAGGRIVTAAGKISHATAEAELHANLNGSIAQYTKRTAMERSADAVQDVIDQGIPPWPRVTPGYVRDPDSRKFIPHPDKRKRAAVVKALELRAEGARIADVRSYLAAKGIKLSYHGTTTLLGSRVLLGEIHFGSYRPNLAAHDAIVDRELWNRVQRMKVSRGRPTKSDRLLARLGVLRCASCGSRMIASNQTQNGRDYPFYRCGRVREDCSARPAISAELVEGIVVEAVKNTLADAEGRASVEQNAREADAAFDRAQTELDAAIRTLAVVGDEPAAVERLTELVDARDRAQERKNHLGSPGQVVTINAAADWNRLSLDARRALIRATVERVTVAPGRGVERVTVELVGE